MGAARGRTDVSYCTVGSGERASLRNVVELPPNVLKNTDRKGGKKKKKTFHVQQEVYNMERKADHGWGFERSSKPT